MQNDIKDKLRDYYFDEIGVGDVEGEINIYKDDSIDSLKFSDDPLN